MGTQLEHYGGSNQQTFGANITLSATRAKIHDLDATTTSLVVKLPDARLCLEGYMVIQIVAHAGSDDFEIQDFDGGELVPGGLIASALDVFSFALFSNSTSAGDWEYGLWTLGSASAPTQVIFPWTLGGTIGAGNEAWKFDFILNSWAQGSTNSTESYTDPGGCRISGVGHIGNGALDHESYDPETWSRETDFTVTRNGAGAAELSTGNDRGFFFGGRHSTTGQDAEYWDKSGGAFSVIASNTVARMLFTAESDGTDFYLIGGGQTATATITARDTVFKYDTAGDSYSSLTPLGQITLFHAGAEDHNGDLITYCGADKSSSSPTEYEDVVLYDISGDSHSSLTDHPNGPQFQLGACHITENDRNYTFGGTIGTNPDASYEHVTQTDSYNVKTDHTGTSTVRGIMQSTLSLTT
jgi:hypothetical protein